MKKRTRKSHLQIQTSNKLQSKYLYSIEGGYHDPKLL